MIAATSSGAGKTSICIGLVASLLQRGLSVQTFKIGPDFLDPFWLSAASQKKCYNLDSFMSDKKYVSKLFQEKSKNADVVLVEGVMGLFDGVSPIKSEGSSAEIARLLKLPVVLIIDVSGMARSIAPIVKGFTMFEEGVHIIGVIANFCGSSKHSDLLAKSLSAEGLPPLIGHLERDSLPLLRKRHLGLVPIEERYESAQEQIQEAASACSSLIDIDLLLKLTELPSCSNDTTKDTSKDTSIITKEITKEERKPLFSQNVKLGIAYDQAFCFYYPDNLEVFRLLGIELVFFSPLGDDSLPKDLDAIFLGGGYPELYASRLSSNQKLLEDIRSFAEEKVVYAECGGLMYLSRSICLGEETLAMASVLPFSTRMLKRHKRLGYVQVELIDDCFWGCSSTRLRGHEFHYSEIIETSPNTDEWISPYMLYRPRLDIREKEGFWNGRVLASYVHLLLAPKPEIVQNLIRFLGIQ